jgi:hypothetical protein
MEGNCLALYTRFSSAILFQLSGTFQVYCSLFDFDFADKDACDIVYILATWNSDVNLFDPEYKDIDCPNCHQQRVYFDREIGYYCMFCGHLLSNQEIHVQMAKRAAGIKQVPRSEQKKEIPILEIKIPDTEKARTDSVEQNSSKHKDEKLR